MPVKYTNRKGVTYTLCQGVTKTGKPRYFFAREPKGEPVDVIPEGYEIRESINGIVSLAKARLKLIRSEEVAAVESAILRHPRGKDYRVDVKSKQIVIYEIIGPSADHLISALGSLMTSGLAKRIQDERAQHAQYTAVMRFTLEDEDERLFYAERMCYRGSIDDWLPLYSIGTETIEKLAKRLVPTLGTDAFFELM